MKPIKVALVQFRMKPDGSREKILEHARHLIEGATKEDVQIICFPERWNFRKGDIKEQTEEYDGPTMKFLRQMAGEFGIYIIGGAIWVHTKEENENHIISAIVNPEGELIAIQRKLHLYLSEKAFFSPGQELKVVDTELGKLGVAICFDMTFPEVARFFALNGVDLILSPVLIRQEGIENWHIYLKARALENRMPICAVNCVGQFNEQIYPGQSLVIDFKKGYETPSKLQVREAPYQKEFVIVDTVDIGTASKLRKKRLGERLLLDNQVLKG